MSTLHHILAGPFIPFSCLCMAVPSPQPPGLVIAISLTLQFNLFTEAVFNFAFPYMLFFAVFGMIIGTALPFGWSSRVKLMHNPTLAVFNHFSDGLASYIVSSSLLCPHSQPVSSVSRQYCMRSPVPVLLASRLLLVLAVPLRTVVAFTSSIVPVMRLRGISIANVVKGRQ